MSQENVEVVRRFTEAWNRRDRTTWLALLHPEAELDWSRSRAPYKGVYRGEGIETFWEEFWSMFEDVQIEIHSITEAGSEVLVISNTAHMRGRSGIEVVARSGLVNRVEDGRITSLRMFQELPEALEAAGLRE